MSDCVVDTSFIALANKTMEEPPTEDVLYQRIDAIRLIVETNQRLRVNPKLLTEYEPHIKEQRNDVVDQFVALLDDPNTVKLSSNTLRKADNAKANTCRWPTHDKHVLAAAIDGDNVTIHVTDNVLGNCAKAVRRIFGFKINHIA